VNALFQSIAKTISRQERRWMQRLGNWAPPRWVRLWMHSASRCGDGWLWFALVPLILYYGGNERLKALAAPAAAVLTGIATFLLMKRLTGRERPRSIAPFSWSRILPPDRFSFPSGHSITAFAVTVPISMFYPSAMLGLLFCAASVAASRIVLGLHFVSDVVVGSAMGAGIGYCAYSLIA
jgi:undecaprenyl-diphosphatase